MISESSHNILKNKYNEIYDSIFPYSSTNDDLKIIHNFSFLTSSYGNIDITKRNIIKLLDAEYVIFPTNQFYRLTSYSLKYLDKNKIVCLNYYLKDDILNKINEINNIIKSEDTKYDKIKQYIKKYLKIENLKCIYFLENMIEPNVMYKKIKFSTEETFLSFSTYSFKRIEYKLKTICQLLEKMGALNIDITYFNDTLTNQSVEGSIKAGIAESGGKIAFSENNKKRFEIHRTYDKKNQMNNINLNIHELYKSIENEHDFFIDKNQFLSDIDLKFLMNSRCLNIIKKYDTILEFEYVNSFEKKILEKAQKFGFEFSISGNKENKESLHLSVEFLDPYEEYESINGNNITPNSEGLMHLEKIINIINDNINQNKKNKKNEISHYLKIHNFLESYMKINNDNKKTLNINFNKKIDLVKTHDHILNYNFSPQEIENLFFHYFDENITFKSFERFRNIFLKPTDNFYDILLKNNYFNIKVIENSKRNNFYENILCNTSEPEVFKELDKLIFLSHQYHIILDYILKINTIFEKALDKLKNSLLLKLNKWKNFCIDINFEYIYLFQLLNNIIYKKNECTSVKQYNKMVSEIYSNPKYRFHYKFHENTKFSYKKYIKEIYRKTITKTSIQEKNYIPEKQIYVENLLQKFNDVYPDTKNILDKINKKMSFFGLDIGILTDFLNNKIKGIDRYNEIDIFYFLNENIKSEALELFNKIRNIIIMDFSDSDEKNIQLINKCLKPDIVDINKSSILYDLVMISENNFTNNENNMNDNILLYILSTFFDNNIIDDFKNNNELEHVVDKYFKKIETNLLYVFEFIKNEINIIINQFFYDKNGFFVLKDFNFDYIKYHLLKNYKTNKISDFNKITVLTIICLFYNNHINFDEFNGEKSFLDIMYNYYLNVIKNYDKFKTKHYEKLELLNIKNKYSIDNLLQNYQKFKIFFTFEDFKKDFEFIFDKNIKYTQSTSDEHSENSIEDEYPLPNDENKFKYINNAEKDIQKKTAKKNRR